ncbi:MAG: hypothetical protein ACQGVC_19685 [Myxococcota bacterium]
MRDRTRGVRWILAAAAALIVWGVASPGLAADPECREECAEARVVCHAAAHKAYRTCHEACTDGDEPCLRTCRWAFSVAKAVCHKQRAECREACAGPTCDCIAGCGEGLAVCREALGECRSDCREDTAMALARCRALAENGAPAPIVRACIQNAEREGYECGLMCQGVLQCGNRFATCVEGCQP